MLFIEEQSTVTFLQVSGGTKKSSSGKQEQMAPEVKAY